MQTVGQMQMWQNELWIPQPNSDMSIETAVTAANHLENECFFAEAQCPANPACPAVLKPLGHLHPGSM